MKNIRLVPETEFCEIVTIKRVPPPSPQQFGNYLLSKGWVSEGVTTSNGCKGRRNIYRRGSQNTPCEQHFRRYFSVPEINFSLDHDISRKFYASSVSDAIADLARIEGRSPMAVYEEIMDSIAFVPTEKAAQLDSQA